MVILATVGSSGLPNGLPPAIEAMTVADLRKLIEEAGRVHSYFEPATLLPRSASGWVVDRLADSWHPVGIPLEVPARGVRWIVAGDGPP